MQIVIEISDHLYKCLQKRIELNVSSEVDQIIAKGTPLPENATNGDVIKALFPNAIYTHVNKLSGMNFMRVKGLDAFGFDTDFYDEWWNAPYKAESENNG